MSQKFSVAVAHHVALHCNTKRCVSWSQALILHVKRSRRNCKHNTSHSAEQEAGITQQ